MKKCYVVTMYRWGDRECHSYVLGVFTKKTKAEKAGKRECGYRGGKYSPECIEVPVDTELDCLAERKIIVPLIRHPLQQKGQLVRVRKKDNLSGEKRTTLRGIYKKDNTRT